MSVTTRSRVTLLRTVAVFAVAGLAVVGAPAALSAAADPVASALVTTGPDLAAAVHYLATTTGANGGTAGTSPRKDGYYEAAPGLADFGLSLDGAFALAAIGTDDADLSKVVDFFRLNKPDAGGRTADVWTGVGTDAASGGSVGKLALLAEVTGYNPRSFGGHDLVAALDSLVCTAPSTAPDLSCAAAGSYANASSVFAQSLAIIAQLRAGDAAGASAAVSYLESLQNASGAWPSQLRGGGDPDVDSTAMAVMALALLPGNAPATAAVAKATAWIAGQQHDDGGFTGTAGNSTNSAGLASQALTVAGSAYQAAIAKAGAFLAGQQNTDGGFNVADGGQSGSDVRASAQVVDGLVGTPFGTLTDHLATSSASADAGAAAAYLIGQLVDGNHLEFAGGFGPNYGGTADVAFALAATGGHDDTLRKIVSYLSKHVADYADPDGKGKFPGPYSGAAAKLSVLAEITGQDPSEFGGFDLLATLTDHVCTSADDTGGCTAAGDFFQSFSSVSQALGVLALARAGTAVPAPALTRLEQLQCADGGFSSTLIAPHDVCTSDVDTTGFAVQALVLVPSAGPVVHDAVAYLRHSQNEDGSWTGAAGENTNSTALALQGLLAAPASADFGSDARAGASAVAVRPYATASDPAVKSGEAWLPGRQNSDGGFGISAASAGSDIPATAQAVPALAHQTLTRLQHHISLATPGGGGSSGGGKPGGSGGPHNGGGGSQDGNGGSQNGGGGSGPVAPPPLAATGADVSGLAGYAIALLLLGGALSIAGRRRVAGAGRHRSGMR